MNIKRWNLLRRQRSVYLFIILFIYCCVSFIFTEFSLHHQIKQAIATVLSSKRVNSQVTLFETYIGKKLNKKKKIMGKTKHQDEDAECSNTSLHSKQPSVSAINETISCKQHTPLISGCKFAKKVYQYNYDKRSCIHEPRVEICFYLNKNRIKCSYDACGENFQGKISFHALNPEEGVVETVNIAATNDAEIAEYFNMFSEFSLENGYEFLFISCDGDKKRTQMVLLGQQTRSALPKTKKGYFSKIMQDVSFRHININLVMIDSVSRAHFYRSLKKTITAFNLINQNKLSQTEILDFEQFQAVHGHSVDNAHALFTGIMYPESYNDTLREDLPVGMDQFYTFFKERHFRTLYQDDACYKAIWGLRMDVGGASSWEEFLQKIKDANIDETGLTFANCKMLEQLEVDHVYNLDENAKVCFNGKQNDAYLLEHLSQKFQLQETEYGKKNIVAYSALNVAHDGGGIRIQSIDADLAKFVEEMSTLNNTLTIIFADHGNTYTDFVYLDTEGKYEMFHPALFMIIPRDVRTYLGSEIMTSLRVNQKRLFTMLDLNHGITYMIERTLKRKGLAGLLPANRTCNDLPLRMPNLCVCDGYVSPVENTTEYIGHLEFAVGQLNNIIVKSSRQKCKRIVPISFENLLQRQEADTIVTIFDIVTASGAGSKNFEEKFQVQIKSVASGSLETYEMEMQNYDRISSFGDYRACSDANKRFRLCICDITTSAKEILSTHTASKVFLGSRTSLYEIFNGQVKELSRTIVEGELFLNIRTFNEIEKDEKEADDPSLIAVSFEVVYVTASTTTSNYNVTVVAQEIDNLKPASPGGCNGMVRPNSVIYLCTLMRKYSIWSSDFDVDVVAAKVYGEAD